MQGQGYNGMPPQGYPMQPPVQGLQSQGYNPNAYPYNAAAAAFNHYNSSEYPCNQFTNPAAFGQGPQGGFKDKVKNFFRFGRPQPNVLLGPDGHPLPGSLIPKNEPGARRQKYVQDKAGVMDYLGKVDYQRANIVPHRNFHGGEFEATAGPLAGNVGPSPFPQSVGFGPNVNAPGFLGSQQMAGPGFVGQPAGYGPGPQVMQGPGPQMMQGPGPQMMQGQGSMYQQQQGQMYQQPGSPLRRDFAPAPVGYNQPGSPLRSDMRTGPAPVGLNQGPVEATKYEVKNLPNGGVEERKETFRREEYITKASKPSEDKTLSEKLQDKVGEAKEWVGDKLSGPGETKESQKADGMAKPEVVGKDLLDSEDRKTKEIINEGQKANH